MKIRYLEGFKESAHNVGDAHKTVYLSGIIRIVGTGSELAAPGSTLLRLDPEHDDPAT